MSSCCQASCNDEGDQKYSARAGHALAADDFEGQGFFDLVVGIPSYDFHYKHGLLWIPQAGAVAVFRNRTINAGGDQRPEDAFDGYPPLHEILGLAEPNDQVGEVFAR